MHIHINKHVYFFLWYEVLAPIFIIPAIFKDLNLETWDVWDISTLMIFLWIYDIRLVLNLTHCNTTHCLGNSNGYCIRLINTQHSFMPKHVKQVRLLKNKMLKFLQLIFERSRWWPVLVTANINHITFGKCLAV